MKTWIILPYDRSPVAKAALLRAARAVRQGRARYGGVLLATAGLDPSALGAFTSEAQVIAGPDVPLEVRLLNSGDPVADLRGIAGELPDAILTAPLRPKGNAPWYTEACAFGGWSHTIMLFDFTPEELKEFEKQEAQPRRLERGIGSGLRRAGAWLHLGVRPHAQGVH